VETPWVLKKHYVRWGSRLPHRFNPALTNLLWPIVTGWQQLSDLIMMVYVWYKTLSVARRLTACTAASPAGVTRGAVALTVPVLVPVLFPGDASRAPVPYVPSPLSSSPSPGASSPV